MAQSINDTGKVASLDAARAAKGKGRGKSKTPAADAAARLAAEEDAGEERAPGLGHNQPSEGEFLRWVQRLRAQDTKVEEAALALKDQRGIRKDLRKEAQASGLVMGELDEAVKDLNTDQVDLVAREERRRLYRMWLGLPSGTQGKLPLPKSDAEAEAARWFKRGEIDGRLGKPRVNPEGCPPERLQDYFKGWETGQEALMRGADLTMGAFDNTGVKKAAAAEIADKDPLGVGDKAQGLADEGGLTGGVKPKGKAVNKTSSDPEPTEKPTLVLTEADFTPGTPLDDANVKSMIEAKREAFDAADRVVALFGTQRRVLKEPDDREPGGFYVDDGETAPVSDVEPAAPEEIAAVAPPTAEELA